MRQNSDITGHIFPLHDIILIAVPGEPSNVSIDSNNSHSLRIRWTAPLEPNGYILGYRVHLRYCTPSGLEFIANQRYPRNQTEVVIDSLEPETEYWVRVSAFTYRGQGVVSSALSATTARLGEFTDVYPTTVSLTLFTI